MNMIYNQEEMKISFLFRFKKHENYLSDVMQ